MKRKTWKQKIGKRLMKRVEDTTQRRTLAEVKRNLAAQKMHGWTCAQCILIAQKLGIK